MDKKIRYQKLKMWREQLRNMEEELRKTLDRRNQVAQEGGISENLAYQVASEDAETLQVRIEEVKKIIRDLEKGGDKNQAVRIKNKA